MALTAQEKDQLHAAIMRYVSRRGKEFAPELNFEDLAKSDLRSAVNDIDAWIESNQASFNNGLTAPFKATASAELKTLYMLGDLAMRQGVDFARALFGGIE